MAAEALLRAYTDVVQADLLVDPARADEEPYALERAATLPGSVRDLLDALLLDGGAGEPVDSRWSSRLEQNGGLLWRHGFLLPRTPPTRGSRIDPQWYVASARLNRALRGRQPFSESLPELEHEAASPPSRSLWDAVVIAAEVERNPRRLTKDGVLRKDEQVRLLEGLGELGRWDLALRHAWATGMVRPAGERLCGFPEAHPRRLVDPAAVLSDETATAARLLLRAVGRDWLDLGSLCALITERAGLLSARGLMVAADALHRMQVVDGAYGPEGLIAVRRLERSSEELPQGFLLTPDLDIVVGQGEIPLIDYGRLCRLAPYQGGDRAHRHRLSREGIAADLAVGHTTPEAFLARFSRTGVPSSVLSSVAEWSRSAERIVLLTGVSVLELPDGRLQRVEGEEPPRCRIIDYGRDGPLAARWSMDGSDIVVRVGQDALTVRAALRHVAEPIGRVGDSWRYRLVPRRTSDAGAVLETLRRMHVERQLPAELEASVLAAHGLDPVHTEEALVVHLPEPAAAALRRDRVAGPLLERKVTETQCLVARDDLPALKARLAELGIDLA